VNLITGLAPLQFGNQQILDRRNDHLEFSINLKGKLRVYG
jgi:hypothetical protein